MQQNLLLLILASLQSLPQACYLCDFCLIACTNCMVNSATDAWITTQCNCKPGYYDNSGNSCPQCNPHCVTCDGGSASSCLSCGAHATLAAKECPCDSGYYYDTGTQRCELCFATCVTCLVAGSSGCSSCYSNAALIGSAPAQCACITGWWPNSSSAQCFACSSQCLNCVSSSTSSCNQCKSGAQLSGAIPTSCVCSLTYFPNPHPGSCSLCHPTCLGCQAAGLFQCISCRGHALLQGSLPTNCYCPSTTFSSPDPSNCVLCAVECLTCMQASANDCLTCKANAAQVSSPGPCTCVGGFYGSASACLSCDPTCLTCSGGTTSECTLCKSNASLTTGVSPNSCACDDHFFPDPTPALCSACHITCFNCGSSADTACTACYANAELKLGLNPGVCVCLSHYFPNPDTGHCSICDSTCANCTSGDALSCSSCQIYAHLADSSSPSKCVCSDAYFPNPSPALCTECHQTCSLCTGPTAAHCTSCHDFAQLTSAPPSICDCVPEAFTLSDTSHCVLCSYLCLTCTGPGQGQCSSCKSSAFLQGPAPNECQCRPGYFPDPDASLCSVCSKLCQHCKSSDLCLVCRARTELKGGKCACGFGFYESLDGMSCEECVEGCGMCIATGCKVCFPGYFLMDGLCVTSCPNSYTALSDGSCELTTPPEPSLTSTTNNTLLLSFSKPMNNTLSSLDISISLSPKDSSTLSWLNPASTDFQLFRIELSIGESYMPNGTIANLTFLNPAHIQDRDGVAIEKTWVSTGLQGYGVPSSSTAALLNSPAASQAAAVSKGGVSAGVATSLLNGNPASALSLINQLQLVSYIAMSKIPIPEEFASTLAGINIGQMLPNPTSSLYDFSINDTTQTPASYIEDYGLNTLLFISNARSVLTTSGLILLSYVPIYLLSKVPAAPIRLYFQGLLQSLRWSVPINIWLTSYLDIAVFSLLQVANVRNSFQSWLPALSFCVAICFLVVVFATPICLLWFLKRNWGNIASRTDKDFNRRWGALIATFKPSNKLSGAAFYPLFLVRRLTLAVTLTLIPERIYILACLNSSISLLSLLYILIIRPYLDPLDLLDTSSSELSTFLIYALVSSFVLDLPSKTRELLNTVGAWVAKVSVAVTVAVSIVRTGVGVWRVLRLYQSHVGGKYVVRREAEVTTAHRSVSIVE